MPQLQWLGTLPRKEFPMAKALEKGTAGFVTGMKEAKKEKIDLAKIDYAKKKGTADIMIKALDNATPQQRDEILAEGTDTSALIVDVYGQEALDSLTKVTAGKGKAASIAKVTTWIRTKKKNIMGYPVPRTRMDLESDIALELKDADWKKNYPEVAAELDVAFPTVKAKPKKKPFWRRGRENYQELGEQDLFDKAMAGDRKAIDEAVRRGYPIGGR